MDIINQYQIYIYERYLDLIAVGKTAETITNDDLWKIFEYFTCIKLTDELKTPIYEYNDIPPEFKEENQLSRNDTGIDCCDLNETIVQCKLRAHYVNLRDCATFLAKQVIFCEKTQRKIIRWPNLILARSKEAKLSDNLRHEAKLFTDKPYSREEIINFCKNLIANPPKYPIEPEPKYILRGYQISAIASIKPNINAIICMPTGSGKNVVIINYILQNINKKYLILVPRIILMYQLQTEFLKIAPELKNKIQLIGDSNIIFKECDITICVYNSVNIAANAKFDKIFVDEAHHIFKPDIYKDDCISNDTAKDNSAKNATIVEHLATPSTAMNLDDNYTIHIGSAKGNQKLNKPKINTGKQEIGTESDDDNDESTDEQGNIVHNLANYNNIDAFADDLPDISDNPDLSTISDLSTIIDKSLSDNTSFDFSAIAEELLAMNLDLTEVNEFIELNENKLSSTDYLKIIRGFEKNNNNVYLSATIDKINNFTYFKTDIRDMIDRGYLTDYTIHVPIFAQNIVSNKNICQYLLNNYQNIIIYCNTQREGNEFCTIMNSLRPKCSEYIDCNTSRRKTADILTRFKNGSLTFLVNVRVLVEGFDAPITKGVCFIHMPRSRTTIIQIIGRALRLHPLKKFANIILPYSIDADKTNIIKFIRTIATNDTRIRKSYENKKLGGYISITEENKIDDNFDKNDPKTTDNNDCNDGDSAENTVQFTAIYDSLGQLLNANESWDVDFNKVKLYINKHGKLPSRKPQETDINIRHIGRWLENNTHYYKYKKDIMRRDEYYNKWTEFINDPKYKEYFMNSEENWMRDFNKLKQFMEKSKHHRRPKKSDGVELHALGQWAVKQAGFYHNKEYEMVKDHIYKLWGDFMNDKRYQVHFNKHIKWFKQFEELKKFVLKHKHLPREKRKNITDKQKDVTDQQKENAEIELNTFYRGQRNTYNGKYKGMREHKPRRLIWENEFEFNDDFAPYLNKKSSETNDKIWYTHFEEFKKFIVDKNRLPTSGKNNSIEENKLAEWFTNQKEQYLIKDRCMHKTYIYDEWTKFINSELYIKHNKK
jgi:superfamily II DNA or RNA helicase